MYATKGLCISRSLLSPLFLCATCITHNLQIIDMVNLHVNNVFNALEEEIHDSVSMNDMYKVFLWNKNNIY